MMQQETMLKLSLILVLIGFLFFYLKFFNRPKNEIQQEIDKILTDDKYKVKGQYE